MCGGKSTTQQTTTIPPEVLARYNAVNAYAENVAQQPFQRYTGQFVAPINEQQMMGISGINNAANMAQPYFNQATQALGTAYNQASPYYGQSLQSLAGGMNQANQLYGTALSGISNAVNIGSQYGTDATRFFNQASNASSPLMSQATNFVNTGLGAAAPLYAQSQQYLKGGTQAVNAEDFGAGQVQKYMSPYMAQVVEAQQKLQEQQNAQQRSALNSQAIGAGAFGGDRSGIAQANLAGQQSLANQATMSNLLQQGYGQALGAFQQQQGVNLQAQQANRAAQQFGQQAAANLAQQQFGQNLAASQQMGNLGQALFGQQMTQGQALAALGQQLYAQNLGASQAQAGIAQNQFGMSAQQAQMMQQAAQGMFGMGSQYASGLAGLGTGAQAAALQGSQAQIGAGTLMQQTQQAQDTAKYQEFLQERGYPFQVAQFLANIAMGTGALSGSTTTTTGPNAFFSDRRLKKDIKEIGETHDGLPIYSFKYKGGDDQQRIGVMADEAREKHPDAVKRVGGVDAVDYEKIANRASEGGGVKPSNAGQGYAFGGNISDQDLAAIIAAQREFLGPSKGGLYGSSAQALPGTGGIVPQKAVHVARLQPHSAPPRQSNEAQQALAAAEQAEKIGTKLFGDKGYLTKQGPIAEGFRTAQSTISGNNQANKTGAGVVPSSNANKSAPPPHPNAPPPANVSTKKSVVGLQPDKSFDVVDVEKEYIPSMDYDVSSAARGGVVPHKSKGGTLQEKVLPYQSEDPYGVEAVNEAESGEKYDLLGEDSGKKSGSSGGKSGNPALKLGLKAAALGANFIPGVGPFLSAGLSGASSFFNEGGVVGRRGYANEGGVKPEGTEETPRYKIDPIVLQDMPEHRQKMVLDIYGPESGGRYDIRYGGVGSPGKTFDPNGPHPNIREPRADGRYSSAAGAGMFIKGTWDDITGGAPMTQGYQDNATWTLASRDYNKRTGRDLDTDLQESGGVTPEIRRVLSPTWEAYTKMGGVKPAEGEPRRQAAGAQYDRDTGKTYIDGQEQKSAGQSFLDTITSPRVLAPLGTGILAMASSPSRYFGGALLTGLGAGLAATQSAEAAESRIQAQNLENIGTGIDLATRGFKELPNGMIVVIMPNGDQLNYMDWVKAGEPTPIGGKIGAALIKEKAAKLGLTTFEQGSSTKEKQTGAGAAGATVAQPSAPGAQQPNAPVNPQTSQAPQAPQAPQINPLQYTVSVPESARKSAEEEERQLYGMARPDMEAEVERNNIILKRAQGQKEAAIGTGKKLTELAAPLASMAAGQQINPGFFAKVNAFIADVYNGGIDQLGLPKEVGDRYKMNLQGLTDYQIAQKASGILTSEMARNLNQDAYKALEYLAQSIANPSMQAGAARELLANAMVENQAALEEALFIQKYGQGRTKTVARRASDEFRKYNTPEMYKEQKDALKKLMEESLPGRDGSRVPVINYILRVGENRDPEIQKRFNPEVVNKKYGFNVTRHILNMAD